MCSNKFDLIVSGEDVNDVLRFGRGLVMASECSSLSLAALLMEAAELAILDSKAGWKFMQDKDLSFDGLRAVAKVKAFRVYHNGSEDYFCT